MKKISQSNRRLEMMSGGAMQNNSMGGAGGGSMANMTAVHQSLPNGQAIASGQGYGSNGDPIVSGSFQ